MGDLGTPNQREMTELVAESSDKQVPWGRNGGQHQRIIGPFVAETSGLVAVLSF